MNALPILIKNSIGMELVEVDGQAVITSQNMATALEYKNDQAIHTIFQRNKESFKDGGILDLNRGFQFGTPCRNTDQTSRVPQFEGPCLKTCDTLLVRMITPGRSDGQGGGGLQDVRVFTKRGALKVCMKSNQPKAVMVQDMLIDLYEKVESGQLIGAERFGRVLEALAIEVSTLKKEMAYLKSQPPVSITLPDDTALPISLERKRGRKPVLINGLRFPEVRDLIVSLCRMGATYDHVCAEIKKRWPDDPDKWVCRSSIGRFWGRARLGWLKEVGIDVTVH